MVPPQVNVEYPLRAGEASRRNKEMQRRLGEYLWTGQQRSSVDFVLRVPEKRSESKPDHRLVWPWHLSSNALMTSATVAKTSARDVDLNGLI
jgi:hypothetical protein